MSESREADHLRGETLPQLPAPREPLPVRAERTDSTHSYDATVTAHAAMDQDRTREVQRALAELLGVDGDEDSIADQLQVEYEASSLEDLDAVPERIEKLVRRYQRPFPSLLQMRLEPEEEVDFAPGMYVTLRYDGTPRVYSVANAPGHGELEFCIRRVPDGRLTPQLCDELSVDDAVVVGGPRLQGPGGKFVLDDRSERDLVFMATGTGVAPLKSMIDYIYETGVYLQGGAERDVWMFLGASWADDLPYHDDFVALDAAYDGFHYVPTLSREQLLTDWDGETAYVQEVFLKYVAGVDTEVVPSDMVSLLDEAPAYDIDARIDLEEIDVYGCGIRGMVADMVATLEEVGVPAYRIEEEAY